MLTPLRIIFTSSLEEEKIPDIWKVGHISAIHKSGSSSKAENYRPISLTSVPGKIMERLIRDRIVYHMTENNFFSPEQHGFISGKSCTTQLLEFLEDLTEALDSGKDVDVIYLYFQKAFDKVPHKRLLKKPWAYGIQGKIHSWIKEFLSNRIQTVLVDGNSSSKAKVKTANRNLGLIFRTFTYLDRDIFMNLFKSLVQTHLEYA